MPDFDEVYPSFPKYRDEVSAQLTRSGGGDFDAGEFRHVVTGWGARTWPDQVTLWIQTDRVRGAARTLGDTVTRGLWG